jgi:hypothetical protein
MAWKTKAKELEEELARLKEQQHGAPGLKDDKKNS